jgi:hypothetical protein
LFVIKRSQSLIAGVLVMMCMNDGIHETELTDVTISSLTLLMKAENIDIALQSLNGIKFRFMFLPF